MPATVAPRIDGLNPHRSQLPIRTSKLDGDARPGGIGKRLMRRSAAGRSRIVEWASRPVARGYLEARPGPGTNSTSSRRRWSLRFGMSAAMTGFLSLFVRASNGGFSLQ
jgi:hypothetical protein